MSFFKTAQISLEYLIIIGLSFAILIPAGDFFYDYSRSSNDETVRSQINDLGNRILVNAEAVYGLTGDSMITLDLTYPDKILDMYILNNGEVIIRYELQSGINEAVFFSRIPLSGPYNHTSGGPPYPLCESQPCYNSRLGNSSVFGGKHNLRLESKTRYVLITTLT
jgi:hypothetical protein